MDESSNCIFGNNYYLWKQYRQIGMGKPTKILSAEEFDKLFNDKERFIRIAYSYINDMEMATDITTDGFMYLWEHRDHLDFDVNIKGYIYNYVKTRCISYLRKRKSILKVQSELYKEEQWRIESGISTLSNEEQIGKLFQSEIIEIYRRELAKMPSLTRNVFLASRLEDMTYHQIAKKFNLTVRQVTSEIQRASFFLRTPLKDYLAGIVIMFMLLHK